MISLLFSILLEYSLMANFSAVPSKPKKVLDVQLGTLLKARPVWVFRVHAVNTILIDLNSCVKAFIPSLDSELPSTEIFCVSLPEQEELDAHHLLEEIRCVHVELGPAVHHQHTTVCADFFLHNGCFLDDGDHLTGGEAHLVSSHQELKGVLVNPHRGVVFLHHLGACCPLENVTKLVSSALPKKKCMLLFPLTTLNRLLVTNQICDSNYFKSTS